MKVVKATVLVLAVILVMTGVTPAQICGDTDDNGTINISDILGTVDFITGLPRPGFNATNGDCDGITGITLSDVVALSKRFAQTGTLNCAVSGSYSFSSAASDTIYLPRLLNIPGEINQVQLLVSGSFSSEAGGFYAPILEQGAGSNSMFELSSVTPINLGAGGGRDIGTNSTVLFHFDIQLSPGFLVGSQNLAILTYDRVAPGIGNIVPEAFDRPTPHLVSIERSGDLYVPVVSYYDATSPSGGFEISSHDLAFNAISGQMSSETFMVDFNHNGPRAAFELTSSEPWIIIDQNTGVTPASVTITADASALNVLDYNGMITVKYQNILQPVDTINVALSVHPEGSQQFPAGDVNCDGARNIEDLTFLVDYFFRGGAEPFPCQ